MMLQITTQLTSTLTTEALTAALAKLEVLTAPDGWCPFAPGLLGGRANALLRLKRSKPLTQSYAYTTIFAFPYSAMHVYA